MKYSYREGIRKQKSRKWIFIPVVAMLLVAYAVVNFFAPTIFYVIEPADRTAKILTSTMPTVDENRLYIPKINRNVAIVSVESDEASALDRGALQRAASSGNPKEGGTYVLTAHRFKLGATPQQTAANSHLFHIDKLSANDDIYVDYEGTRYAYKILERKRVEPSSTDIETRSETVQLVVYPAQLSGNDQLRDVVTAKLTGKIIWTNGQPKLQSL